MHHWYKNDVTKRIEMRPPARRLKCSGLLWREVLAHAARECVVEVSP